MKGSELAAGQGTGLILALWKSLGLETLPPVTAACYSAGLAALSPPLRPWRPPTCLFCSLPSECGQEHKVASIFAKEDREGDTAHLGAPFYTRTHCNSWRGVIQERRGCVQRFNLVCSEHSGERATTLAGARIDFGPGLNPEPNINMCLLCI